MNANELAKLLEVDSWYKLVTREEIATMLRQQQIEIEALKKQVEATKKLEYQRGFELGSSLTTYNKPKVEALENENDLLKAQVKRLKEIIEKSIDMNNVLSRL
jgi:hypothetical protein